jgi:hypothetical protein
MWWLAAAVYFVIAVGVFYWRLSQMVYVSNIFVVALWAIFWPFTVWSIYLDGKR